MADSIWWTKMLHKDFCAHYCEMSDSEIVADVRRSVASLMMQRSEGSDFGALMVRMAMQRIKEKHDTAVSNGSQGGRPRKETTADGDTREDSQAKPDGSAITRNETRAHDALEPSATISQDAAHSKAADDRKAPTSCTHYDQEADHRISTDEALDLLRAGVMDSIQAPTRRCCEKGSEMPSDVGEVYAFAAAEGLDSVDAYECWSATIERGGKTADGRKVRNWKAYVRRWCATRAEKRRTA